MKTNLYLFAFCSVILSSCGTSKTPAESDVANILKEQFVNCPIIEIQNVKKINGAPGESENFYKIKASFDLVFKPIAENTVSWSEYSQKDALKKSIFAEQESAIKVYREKKQKLKNEFEAKSESQDMFLKQDAELDAEMLAIDRSFNEKVAEQKFTGIHAHLTDGYSVIRKSCKVEVGSIGSRTLSDAYLSASSESDAWKKAEFMGNGGTMSYTVDWLMLKTEQGWQLKL